MSTDPDREIPDGFTELPLSVLDDQMLRDMFAAALWKSTFRHPFRILSVSAKFTPSTPDCDLSYYACFEPGSGSGRFKAHGMAYRAVRLAYCIGVSSPATAT